MEQVLRIEKISYSYHGQGGDVPAVKDASGVFNGGCFYAITGRSGSGKSTLLSLMAGLDLPQRGKIYFQNQPLNELNRNLYRSRHIGIIFQSFNLLPHLNALENVTLALELCRWPAGGQKQRALQLLERVGIDEGKAGRRVLKLSGGEQQRIAIARALAANPPLILADEPTGNLDSETGNQVIELLLSLAHDEERCVVVVTHSEALAKRADEVWRMKDGCLQPDTPGCTQAAQ